MARKQTVATERIQEFSHSAVGAEPRFAESDINDKNYRVELMRALGWYARESSTTESKDWYIKLSGWTEGKGIPDWEFTNVGYVKRLVSRGFPEKYVVDAVNRKAKFLATRVSYYKQLETAAKETAAAKPTKNKVYDTVLLDELENVDYFVDSYIMGDGKNLTVNISKLNINQQKAVRTYLDKQLAEYETAHKTLNQDGDNAYNLTGTQCKQMSNKIRETLNVLNISTTQVKKVRLTKAKPVSKIVEKVKYCLAFNEFKSLPPEKVVGAKVLLAFNTKTRFVCVFTSNPMGFTFKGTTLMNVIEETCKSKRLRKPEEQLKAFNEASRLQVDKVFDKVNAVGYTPKCRINTDIIFLKVW
jgi:hypothetical protein